MTNLSTNKRKRYHKDCRKQPYSEFARIHLALGFAETAHAKPSGQKKLIMGNKGSSPVNNGQLTKKGTFLNCACAKGKEETDGVATSRGRVTKLTEEEWAAVKAGRVHCDNAKQPSLFAEELLSNSVTDNKKVNSNTESKASNGHSQNGSSDTAPNKKKDRSKQEESEKSNTSDSKTEDPFQNLRFKVGDRVRCVCSRYGNKYEAGSVIKIGFREKDWPLSKPTAPYQGLKHITY